MTRCTLWPSDVLAGGVLGVLIGKIAVRVNQRRFSLAASPGGIGLKADI